MATNGIAPNTTHLCRHNKQATKPTNQSQVSEQAAQAKASGENRPAKNKAKQAKRMHAYVCRRGRPCSRLGIRICDGQCRSHHFGKRTRPHKWRLALCSMCQPSEQGTGKHNRRQPNELGRSQTGKTLSRSGFRHSHMSEGGKREEEEAM